MKRAVITGIGAVTPVGNTFHDSWEAATKGLSGIGPVTRFDAAALPWKAAGEVKRFEREAYLSAREQRRVDLFVLYALAASLMATADADLGREGDYLAQGGVIIGSSRGGICMMEDAFARDIRTGRGKRLTPYIMPATTISMASSYTAQKLGIKGYCLGISNACTSGASAIGEALRMIRSGHEGPLLAGGSDAPVCRTCFEGYGFAGALSRNAVLSASRPFDGTRDGFVLAEGACVVVVEELEKALKRGARIYGEIAGYAGSCDAFHQTKPDPEGGKRAMLAAMADAGLTADDIDLVSAHATSTPLGDRVEAEAIRKVFGRRVPVCAIKSVTGHMLGASGALEAAFAVMSIREGIIPPTINLKKKGEGCDVEVVTQMTRAEIGTALSGSYGFGGVNAVLVLRKAVHEDR
jgi:3-oxoacyl-[acyl-carrier-protein] synthase II